MNKPYKLYYTLISVLFIFNCRQQPEYSVEGKWQSLNDPSTVIEFMPDGKIDLYKSGTSFWGQVMPLGELEYFLKRVDQDWLDIIILKGKENFTNGRVEIVTPERIRIYFHKHHDILDLADEYHRTEDFTSYQDIMNKVLEQPEK